MDGYGWQFVPMEVMEYGWPFVAMEVMGGLSMTMVSYGWIWVVRDSY